MKLSLQILLTGFVAAAWSATDSTGLLTRIDNANKVGEHFAFEMKVESFKGDALKEQNQITGFTYLDKAMDIHSIIHFTAPKSVSGRKMLIEGSYIWALFPKTKNLIRLTPLQILLGEAAYGDVLRIVYARDYSVTSTADTAMATEKGRVLDLVLKKERVGCNYPQVRLVVESKTLRILEAQIFGSGGRKIKTARFGDPTPFNGKLVNRQVDIFDAIKPEQHSTLRYLKMGSVNVPEINFSKDMLQRARVYDF